MTFPSAPVTVNGPPMGRHPCETSRSTWAPANLAPTAPSQQDLVVQEELAPALLRTLASHAPDDLGARHIVIDVVQEIARREAEGVAQSARAGRHPVGSGSRRTSPPLGSSQYSIEKVSTGPVPSANQSETPGSVSTSRGPADDRARNAADEGHSARYLTHCAEQFVRSG